MKSGPQGGITPSSFEVRDIPVKCAHRAQQDMTDPLRTALEEIRDTELSDYGLMEGTDFWMGIAERFQKIASGALDTAPSQPAPDALREAFAKIIYDAFPFDSDPYHETKPPWNRGGNSIRQDDARRAADKIIALSAPVRSPEVSCKFPHCNCHPKPCPQYRPVPSPDGAGDFFKTCPGCEMRRTCRDARHCYGPSHAELKERFALSPSDTGAAEPVAHRIGPITGIDYGAAPPVRDREAIARLVYHAGGPALPSDAWREALRVADAILSLPQPSAGEREALDQRLEEELAAYWKGQPGDSLTGIVQWWSKERAALSRPSSSTGPGSEAAVLHDGDSPR